MTAPSDIRWRVIRAGAPVGLDDVVLGEFTAPDKRAATAELATRIAGGEFPADAIVIAAVHHELVQGKATKRIRAREIKRQARLAIHARGGRRRS